MFHVSFFSVQLAEGMETPCRPRREKKADGQETRGRQQWWEPEKKILIFFFFLFITTFVDLVCVCFYSTVALCVQIQTGTVEKRTPRMERTCVIQCSSPDPLELERRLQSMLVHRSWASRYKTVKIHNCDTCVEFSILIS